MDDINYIKLLEIILINAESFRNSIILLLKDELENTNIKRPTDSKYQHRAIHAQFLMYICLEEIGKFFLIINQYPTPLNNINLVKIGFYNHDRKIEALLKKADFPNNLISNLTKFIRNFKEPNLYVEYKNGKIIGPIANRGEGVLEGITEFVSNSLIFARGTLNDFKKARK